MLEWMSGLLYELWEVARFDDGLTLRLAEGLSSEFRVTRKFCALGLARLAVHDRRALRALRWPLTDEDPDVAAFTKWVVNRYLPRANEHEVLAPGTGRNQQCLDEVLRQLESSDGLRAEHLAEIHQLHEQLSQGDWAEETKPPRSGWQLSQMLELFAYDLLSEVAQEDEESSEVGKDNRGAAEEAMGDRPFLPPEWTVNGSACWVFGALERCHLEPWIFFGLADVGESAAPLLRRALSDPDPWTKRFAVTMVGHMARDTPQFRIDLLAALDDNDPTTASIAVLALSGIPGNSREVAVRMGQLLHSPAAELRASTASALERIGEVASCVLPDIDRALHREADTLVLKRLLRTIGMLGDPARALAPRISHFLNHTDENVQRVALHSLLLVADGDLPFDVLTTTLRRMLHWMEKEPIAKVSASIESNSIAVLVRSVPPPGIPMRGRCSNWLSTEARHLRSAKLRSRRWTLSMVSIGRTAETVSRGVPHA